MATAIAPGGRAAAIFLCAWLLAACGSLSLNSGTPDQGEAATSDGAPEQTVEAPSPESAEASPADETTALEAQVSTAVPVQPEQQIDDDPEQLMGMGTARLSGFRELSERSSGVMFATLPLPKRSPSQHADPRTSNRSTEPEIAAQGQN